MFMVPGASGESAGVKNIPTPGFRGLSRRLKHVESDSEIENLSTAEQETAFTSGFEVIAPAI